MVGRKNFHGSGALWRGRLAAMMFSLLQTLQVWGLDTGKWLTAHLSACAKAGGEAPPDPKRYLPWNMTEQEREGLSIAKRKPPDAAARPRKRMTASQFKRSRRRLPYRHFHRTLSCGSAYFPIVYFQEHNTHFPEEPKIALTFARPGWKITISAPMRGNHFGVVKGRRVSLEAYAKIGAKAAAEADYTVRGRI